MCHAPAVLYRIDRRGYLREGYYADIAVVRRNQEPYTVSDADVISKCGWTPFAGTNLHFSVERTYVNGDLAYVDGKVVDTVRGKRMIFGI